MGSDIARRVRRLRKLLGRTEAARVLEIHPTSLDRAEAGQPLRRNTETLLRQRLDALSAAEAKGAQS
jgi:hypothetical protein